MIRIHYMVLYGLYMVNVPIHENIRELYEILFGDFRILSMIFMSFSI